MESILPVAAFGRADPLQLPHSLQRGDVLLDLTLGNPDDLRQLRCSHPWMLEQQLKNPLLVGRQFFPDLFPRRFYRRAGGS